MKALIFGLLIASSLNSYASSIDNSRFNYSSKLGKLSSIGLDKSEVKAIEEASNTQFNELADCVFEQDGDGTINETSCINDVLGDVHN